MRKRLFILFALSTLICKAQPGKEAWHWRFGQAALDFSSGSPVSVTPSTSYFLEACADISDENTGQHLFFTNGVIASDKNYTWMSNGTGMYGNASTSQTLIVPWPGNVTKYFIISADQSGGPKGVHYSIVDLSQNGGFGKVTVKNKKLTPAPATEKITAVRHCNGTDYWILTHSFNSNAFYAYKVSSVGIDTIPIVSNTGTSHHSIHSGWEASGYMKASPNGARLALGIGSDSLPIIEILDMNNSNGLVSNPITINMGKSGGCYGVSFSPDNSKLYATVYPGDTISAIYQYDLSSGIPAIIIASQINIGEKNITPGLSGGGGMVYGMQLGPDKKIYIARPYVDTLTVINNPNLGGAACNLQWNGVVLGPPSWHYAQYGLPNFIDANYAGIQINIPDVQQCNTFTTTTLDAGAGFSNYFWSTGASTQTISINAPGRYWVTVTNAQGCTRTDTVDAFLLNPVKEDTLVCDTFHANVTQGGVLGYNWFDNNHNPIRNFTQSGNYYVDINYVSGCAIRDSINVTIVPSPQINIGADTTFCKGNLILNASNPLSTYQWSTGETSATITVTKPGTYFVKVKDNYGCTDSDTMLVRAQLGLFNFEMPNIVTPNGDNINDEVDFSKYQFSSFQINIFNRWGQEIFKSSDVKAVWKPTSDDGSYYYTGQYKIDCGADTQTKNIKGFITILR